MFCKEGVLKNFTNFTGKHLCQSLFFNKFVDLKPATATLLKKRLWKRYFPVNFVKFLRAIFYETETYSELCQTSKMNSFTKTVNDFQPITIFSKSSILDVWQRSEYASVEMKTRIFKRKYNKKNLSKKS